MTLTCRECGFRGEPSVVPTGPHRRANCARCGKYIKFLKKKRSKKKKKKTTEPAYKRIKTLYPGDRGYTQHTYRRKPRRPKGKLS